MGTQETRTAENPQMCTVADPIIITEDILEAEGDEAEAKGEGEAEDTMVTTMIETTPPEMINMRMTGVEGMMTDRTAPADTEAIEVTEAIGATEVIEAAEVAEEEEELSERATCCWGGMVGCEEGGSPV